ncbi:MAG: PGF-pre-PGF domain-containing protein [Methanomicrobiaceae archaeon]|nr:PGF-pre-PGF domain-containing protein [Methanomicrobiaceae archaeon]
MGIKSTGRWYGCVVVLVLCSISTAPVSAADWYVSTTGEDGNNGSFSAPWRTITYAVEENASVADGDTIHLAAGTYEEWGITLDKNLTLSGEGAGSTIIDGMDTSCSNGGVLRAHDVIVSLEGLTIQHGSATHLGGGVYASESDLTIADCHITGNTATGHGGGIYLDRGTLTIAGGTITGNSAENWWGGEAIDAAFGGGGIGAYNATVTISLATIGGNQAREGGDMPRVGGGISQRGGTLTIADSALFSNTAGFGGGLYLNGVTAMITGCTILENQALYALIGNYGGSGGGIFLQGGSLALVNTDLQDNVATLNGGGMHAGDGTVTISDGVIADNDAEYMHGGGVSHDGGTLEIQGGRIENNIAPGGYGGGVWCANADAFTLSGTSVAVNSAMYGGGVYQEVGAAVVTDTLLSNNYAIHSGGGVCQDGGTMTVSGSTIYHNRAGGWFGGGVYQMADSSLALTGSTITDNTAQYGGWGVHSRGTVTIANCLLRNTYNFYREGGIATLATAVTASTNIVGGPFRGGNYWGSPAGDGFSDTCIDADGDGFGDTPYTVTEATDAYPLTTPVAAFTVDPASGTAPLTVRFSNTAVGTVTSCTWDFGDGDTDTANFPSVDHTFTSAGTYTVSLNVTDGSGYSKTATTITVSEAPGPAPTITPAPTISPAPTLPPTPTPASTRTPGGGGPSDTAVAAATDLSPGENVTLILDPSKSAFYAVVVRLGDAVDDLLVTARDYGLPGSTLPPPNGTVFQVIEVTLYRTTDDALTEIHLEFTVPLAWLEEEGFAPVDIVLYRRHDGAWEALPTTFVNEEDGKAYFTATSPGFSLFAIVAVEHPAVSEDAATIPIDEPSVEETVGEEPTEPVSTAIPTPAPTQAPLLWAPLLAMVGVFLLRRLR